MSQSNIGSMRPGPSSVLATPADGADSSAQVSKGLDFPTGTADHLFGQKKLVQVLTADSKKAATDHSLADRWFKGNDGLAEKAEHAGQLFDSIQFHRGGQKGSAGGEVSAYNALVLLANILRSAKAEVIAVIEASLEPSKHAPGNHTFTLTIGEKSFEYNVRNPGENKGGASHFEQLHGLMNAHQAVKNRLHLLAETGTDTHDAGELAHLRLQSYADAVNVRHRQSLGEITKAVLLSYAPAAKPTTSLGSIPEKLELLTPWLEDARRNGATPPEFTRLVELLPRGIGEDRPFAVAVANLLVGKGLLAPAYRGPGSLDEAGDEIPPPPPLPLASDLSHAPTARHTLEAQVHAFELGRIDEETDDDLMRESSPAVHSQRGSSLPAEGAAELPPPPDSDDEDDWDNLPPPPPPPLPRSESVSTVEGDELHASEIDDDAPPPPPSGSAQTPSAADRALFEEFFSLHGDEHAPDDGADSSTSVQSGFRPPASLTELDDDIPPPPPPPLPDQA